MTAARISDLAYAAARRFGDKAALTVAEGPTLGFAELDIRAGRVAGALAEQGIRHCDRVVLHLPNGWPWVVAYHAILRLGAVAVPANFLLTADEVAFIAADSEAAALIVPAERRAAFGREARVFTLGDAADAVPFEALLAGPYHAPVERSPEDLAAIGYTSGTTGRPRGAMTTHGGLFASLAGTATLHVRTCHDVVASALPFSHVYGNIVLNTAFLTGARIVTTPRFDAGAALRTIAQEKATLFEGVPTMYYQMLAHPDIDAADLKSLTRCTVGGQTMPRAKIDAVTTRFGCPLLELWGMTELAGPAVTHSPYWVPRPGSIGLPFPGTEVRIADLAAPTLDAAAGESGELMVRGALVTAGYWRDPGATAAAIDPEGWLATGDIARTDPDGYIFVVDRRKDMIITAGYNIYPAELEQVIATHPAVVMVAVAGVSDEEKGELAHAFVVRKAGHNLSAAELIEHCRKRLAAYKVPRDVIFVEDLPRNSTGKTLRRHLPQLLQQKSSAA